MMKKAFFASALAGVVLCACGSHLALAQDAAQKAAEVAASEDNRLQLAIEVVRQSNTLPEYSQELAEMTLGAKNWLIRQNPVVEKEIIATVDKVAEKYKDKEGRMLQAVATAWASYLKEDELQAVLDFFKTDAGQKFATYQPRIIGESVANLQNVKMDMTAEIVMKAKAELTKKGHKFP